MKKNILLLGLAASLILAGCAKPETNSSVGDQSSETSSSESSSSENAAQVRRDAMVKFMRAVAPNNATVTSSGLVSSKSYWLGTKAVVFEGTSTSGAVEKYGYLVNGNQGIFQFSLDAAGTTVTLGDFADPSTDITEILVNPSLVFATMTAFTEFFLGAGGTGLVYTFDVSSIMSSSKVGQYFVGYMLALSGLNSSLASYVTALSLTLDDGNGTGASINATLDLTALQYGVAKQSATIGAIGETTYKVVEDYLKNPIEVQAPTDWSAAAKRAINSVFGTNASKVIFPTGLVTYAFTDGALTQTNSTTGSEETVGVSFVSYGSNITDEYAALLTKAGYAENADFSGTNSSGDVVKGYTIETTAATATSGATYLLAQIAYSTEDKTTTVQIYYAKNGLEYKDLTLDEANTKVAALNKSIYFDIPTLPASDLVTGVAITDYSGATGYEDYKYFWRAQISIAKESDALAYAQSYVATVKNYSDSGKYTFAKDGAVVYFATYSGQTAAILEVDVSYDKAGAYAGAVTIYAYGAI